MRNLLFILLFFWAQVLFSQDSVWIAVEKGSALYYAPSSSEWIPIIVKEKVPIKTFILIKQKTDASAIFDSDVIQLPVDSYIFLDDVYERDRIKLVLALSQIEAEQLPKTDKEDKGKKKPLGIIYGDKITDDDSKQGIPYETERVNAVEYFVESGSYSAALLTLKRIVTKYPHAYLNQYYTNHLFALYNQFQLFGFLYEESKLLLQVKDEAGHENVKRWYELAKDKILTR